MPRLNIIESILKHKLHELIIFENMFLPLFEWIERSPEVVFWFKSYIESLSYSDDLSLRNTGDF